MRHLSYLAVLLGCLLGTAPLEVFLSTRVYSRPVRLLLTLAPVVMVFVAWDLVAIAAGHWHFDGRSITGVLFPGGLPLDELLFFIVVPICAILTLEAVRAVKGWDAGDEHSPRSVGPARVVDPRAVGPARAVDPPRVVTEDEGSAPAGGGPP